MTPSSALILLSQSLLWAIRIAASPLTATADATHARRDAVKFARQAYREVASIEHMAEMSRLMEQAANRPRPRHTYQRNGCWYYLGGY